jgi:hypothetical protein
MVGTALRTRKQTVKFPSIGHATPRKTIPYLKEEKARFLFLERPLLVRVRDAEGYQLAVQPRDISIPLLQRLLRHLASSALLLER